MHAIPLRQNRSNVTVKSFFIRVLRTDNGGRHFNIAGVENQAPEAPKKMIQIKGREIKGRVLGQAKNLGYVLKKKTPHWAGPFKL